MRVVGFNLSKITAEKLKDSAESLKFNTKIDIPSIAPFKSDFLKSKDELLAVEFVYTVLYEPEFAKIEFKGSIVLSVEPKVAREILKGFKDKISSDDFRVFILNIIFRKANIRALQIEDELGLPPHIPLATLKKDAFKEEKKE
jgi:hypothetical protein